MPPCKISSPGSPKERLGILGLELELGHVTSRGRLRPSDSNLNGEGASPLLTAAKGGGTENHQVFPTVPAPGRGQLCQGPNVRGSSSPVASRTPSSSAAPSFTGRLFYFTPACPLHFRFFRLDAWSRWDREEPLDSLFDSPFSNKVTPFPSQSNSRPPTHL